MIISSRNLHKLSKFRKSGRLKHLLCFIDTVDVHTQTEQFEHSFRDFNIFWKHTFTVNTADKHILEALEDTTPGGPMRARPTGQFHRIICLRQCESYTPFNQRVYQQRHDQHVA